MSKNIKKFAILGAVVMGAQIAGHLANAGIPSYLFDMDKELVLFCAGGLRSALGAKSLKDMGFEKVSHIDGGFGAMKNKGFKIT